MKFIVLGASGYVGRHIYEIIRNEGYEVIGTKYTGNYDGLFGFDITAQSLFDVLPKEFLKGNEPIYCIICASNCKIDKCFLERESSYNINVTSTVRLANELNSKGIKFVFLSTEFVFNGERGYYNEAIEPCPVNEYGWQKVEVEKYIISQMADNLIFRLSKIVSDEPKDVQFFSDVYHKLCKGRPIECIKGQVFAPTYVKDIAYSIIKAFQKNLSGLYHVTNQEFFQREELARQFLLTLQTDAEIIVKPVEEFGFPESRPMKTYLDGTKFIRETGMHFTSMSEVMVRFARKVGKVLYEI